MRKIGFTVILILLFLAFIIYTFIVGYEELVITRLLLIVFSLTYMFLEVKKEYFLDKKNIYLCLSISIVILLFISIIMDNELSNGIFNATYYAIPIFFATLLKLLYNDLYQRE